MLLFIILILILVLDSFFLVYLRRFRTWERLVGRFGWPL